MPRLSMLAIFDISTAQFLTSPSAPFTSTYRKTCGLRYAYDVTVPVIATSLVISNIACEWCARRSALLPSATATAPITARAFLMCPRSSSVAGATGGAPIDHDLAALDHDRGVEQIPVPVERVRRQHDDVGHLPHFERADVLTHLHECSAVGAHHLHDVLHRKH